MKAPFVLVEGLDVSVLRSLPELTGFLEAQDVRDGVYEAFDASGRMVTLTAASDGGPVFAEAGELAVSRLRTVLAAHLAAVGPERVEPHATDEASLDSLIGLLQRSRAGRVSPRG